MAKSLTKKPLIFTAWARRVGCATNPVVMPDNAPYGIVVHSTGVNNPNLKRYVDAPAQCGENPNKNYFDTYNSTLCPHAVIGLDIDGEVRVAHLLPWKTKSWTAGTGSKGSYNGTYIQFEMCEDDLTDEKYFNEVMAAAVKLCRKLMSMYPTIRLENVISHKEAAKRGYASSHVDPEHWLSKFGKDMKWFREYVRTGNPPTETYVITATKTVAEKQLAEETGKLKAQGYAVGVSKK